MTWIPHWLTMGRACRDVWVWRMDFHLTVMAPMPFCANNKPRSQEKITARTGVNEKAGVWKGVCSHSFAVNENRSRPLCVCVQFIIPQFVNFKSELCFTPKIPFRVWVFLMCLSKQLEGKGGRGERKKREWKRGREKGKVFLSFFAVGSGSLVPCCSDSLRDGFPPTPPPPPSLLPCFPSQVGQELTRASAGTCQPSAGHTRTQ